MTEIPSKPDLDDELVSAYLDDELPAAERTQVEARLAADPAARQLLHQLRAVSQAMQGLPQEAVGHDLNASILRSVEQTNPPAGERAADRSEANDSTLRSSNDNRAPSDQSVPMLTIGRTRRGWFWAVAAVAASLLIMAVQSERQASQKQPAVALRDQPLAAGDAQRPSEGRSGLEFRALPEPSVGPHTDQLAMGEVSDRFEREAIAPGQARREAGQVRDDLRSNALPDQLATQAASAPPTKRGQATGIESPAGLANAPLPPSAAPALTLGLDGRADAEPKMAQASTDSVDGGPQDAGIATLATGGAGVGLRGGRTEALAQGNAALPAQAGPASESGEDQLVVVHVLAKRESLQSETFDKLLSSNGIRFAYEKSDESKESSASATEALARRRFTAQGEVNRAMPEVAQRTKALSSDEELVLVTGSQSAILACLKDLHRDSENYLAIAVSDLPADKNMLGRSPIAAAEAEATSAAALNKPAEELDWTKFNRGIVPRQDDVSLRGANRYYQTQGQNERDRAAGGYGGYGPSRKLERQLSESRNVAPEASLQSEASGGQAVRLQARLDRQGGQQQPAHSEAATTDGQVATSSDFFGVEGLPPAAARPRPNTLNVLFILSPVGEGVTSPPARNKAQ